MTIRSVLVITKFLLCSSYFAVGSRPSSFGYQDAELTRSTISRLVEDAVEQYNIMDNTNDGTRKLQTTGDAFRSSVCRPFTDGFTKTAPGSSCSCDSSKYTILCNIPRPNCFQDISGCVGGETICATGKVKVDFSIRGRTLSVSYVEVDYKYTGDSPYEGERTRVSPNNCEQYFSLDGVEYRCNSCRICSNDQVTLDCSNIQPTAIKSECSPMEIDANNPFIDMCPMGGAPTPTGSGAVQLAFAAIAFCVSTVVMMLAV